jgi:hypothetical protein
MLSVAHVFALVDDRIVCASGAERASQFRVDVFCVLTSFVRSDCSL